MAEIGGAPAEEPNINLDSAESRPGTSNAPQREGQNALKRILDAGLNASPDASTVKKKKTAEELASTTKGRNQAVKKLLKEKKKQQRKEESKNEFDMEQALSMRDKLLDRLAELEEREMADDDRVEAKKVQKEERVRAALFKCEKAIKDNGGPTYTESEERTINPIHISIPSWPCLDMYVHDFAFERFSTDNPIHCMTTSELSAIIAKEKSRNPDAKFPMEETEPFERLLNEVNWKIRDAAQLHRWEILEKNLEQYPGVDVEALPKVVKTEDGAERSGLRKLIDLVRTDLDVNEIDVINLDDEDDSEKEGDDDEFEEEDDEEESKVTEDDDHLSNMADCTGKDASKMELPDVKPTAAELKLNGATAAKAEEGRKKDEQEKDRSDSRDEKEENEIRPDSREGKDMMEGGTSTTSPTLERDERMKSMEKNEATNQGTTPTDKTTGFAGDETMEGATEERDATRAWNVAAETIVLEEEDDEMEVVPMEPSPPERKAHVTPPDPDNGKAILPPAPPQLTASQAWRVKQKHIQAWVNRLTAASPEENEDGQQQSSRREDEDEDEDDGIVCLQDDFEFDSVSHSGLEFRKKLKDQPDAAGEEVEERKPPLVARRDPALVEVIELD